MLSASAKAYVNIAARGIARDASYEATELRNVRMIARQMTAVLSNPRYVDHRLVVKNRFELLQINRHVPAFCALVGAKKELDVVLPVRLMHTESARDRVAVFIRDAIQRTRGSISTAIEAAYGIANKVSCRCVAGIMPVHPEIITDDTAVWIPYGPTKSIIIGNNEWSFDFLRQSRLLIVNPILKITDNSKREAKYDGSDSPYSPENTVKGCLTDLFIIFGMAFGGGWLLWIACGLRNLCTQITLWLAGTLIIFGAAPAGMLIAHRLFFGDFWPFWGPLARLSMLTHGRGVGV